MSLRRKFTFLERQLEACREPVGFMQTERGAASEVCRRPGLWWSRSLRIRARVWCWDEVLRGVVQARGSARCGLGARPQCSDTVLGHTSWMRCLDVVLGHGARSYIMDVVLGRGARPQVMDVALGCGAQEWCSVAPRGCGAQTWCSGAVLDHTLWTRCSAVALGRGAWM